MQPKIASLLIIATIALLTCSSIDLASAMSGYVLDSSGCGIAGAKIKLISGTPYYPFKITDESGYYEFEHSNYPEFNGSYQMDVRIYPPKDTDFVDYRNESYMVQLNTTNNFTLTRGYKLTGYVMDQNGKPVEGEVFLDRHWSGEWSNSSNGYFYVTAPPGTYTVQVSGGRGRWDSASYAYQVLTPTITLNSDISKNIIVLNTQDSPESTELSTSKFFGLSSVIVLILVLSIIVGAATLLFVKRRKIKKRNLNQHAP